MLRYVERNPLRAKLVKRIEEWRYGSAWRRHVGDHKAKSLLSTWPLRRPRGWLEYVNTPQTEAELDAVRRCVQRGTPFGDETWVSNSAARLGLNSTLRPRGRPRKKDRKET